MRKLPCLKGGEIMTKYNNILSNKIVEEKIDEAMELSKESGKEAGFNICLTGGEIITTAIEKGGRDFVSIENKCPGLKIGSFHVHPGSKDAIPSPRDIDNIRYEKYRFLCIGTNVNSINGDRKIVRCFAYKE